MSDQPDQANPPQADNPPTWAFKQGLEITVVDTSALHTQAQTGNGVGFVLLDVREADELTTASIDGAVHIPMGDIPSKINELDVDEDTTIAVLCRSGKRSLQVALYLHEQGLSGARSVSGGINWWSQRLDPSIKQY